MSIKKRIASSLLLTLVASSMAMPSYAHGIIGPFGPWNPFWQEYSVPEGDKCNNSTTPGQLKPGSSEGTTSGQIKPGEQTPDITTSGQLTPKTTESQIEVGFNVINQWPQAFNGQFNIKNTSGYTLENWIINVDFKHKISNMWNATIIAHEGDTYTIKGFDWNKDITTGQALTVGFIAEYDKEIKAPTNAALVSKELVKTVPDVGFSFGVMGDWGTGYNGVINVTNRTTMSPLESWILEFDYEGNIDRFWTADLLSHEGNHYVVKHYEHNSVINPGETLTLGFQGTPGNVKSYPTNWILRHVGLGDDISIDLPKPEPVVSPIIKNHKKHIPPVTVIVVPRRPSRYVMPINRYPNMMHVNVSFYFMGGGNCFSGNMERNIYPSIFNRGRVPSIAEVRLQVLRQLLYSWR